ncbi:MAG: protein translocase subunit SecD [Bacillota bacterium]
MGNKRSITYLLLIALAVGLLSYVVGVGLPATQPDGTRANLPVYKQIPLGLDLRGGVRVVFEAQDSNLGPVNDASMDAATKIIESRVNGLGVSEPVIQRKGDRQILVELAGVTDPEEAVKRIGSTAVLEFRAPDGTVLLTGADVADAREALSQDASRGAAVVNLEFKPEGAKKFADMTSKYLGQRIGIYLDGNVLTNPEVQTVIPDGKAEITGYGDLSLARNDAILIKSGSLPVKLDIVENRTVSATLGADSIRKTVTAGVIGVIGILLFMVVNYGWMGLVADFALLVYVLLNLLALWGIDAVMTLPGIAGVILSIGMALDANILIFERIREELRNGKTVRAALESGFHRAMAAVIDSNVTTLIAAGLLYWRGTGPIKGFAVTLGIGVMLSMFTAITFTHWILRLLVNSGLGSRRFFGVREGEKQHYPTFQFMKTAKTWITISLIVTLVGLGSLAFRGMNKSIDFTAGTYVQVVFDQPTSAASIRAALGAQHQGATIQGASDREFTIKTITMTDEESNALIKTLGDKVAKVNTYSKDLVQPSISRELVNDAFWLLIVSSLLQVVYITIRFEYKFAITSIVALLHDALIVLGLFSLFQLEVNATFIAAILTIIGYSMNDTVVVFDRIRENLKLRKRGENLEDLVDTSVNQVVSRTVKTGATTLIAIVAVLIFGGRTVREFSAALTMGILSGTYSSVFIASAIWAWWEKWSVAQTTAWVTPSTASKA